MDQKLGRNDPCSCGSGKKYKNCCLIKPAAPKKFTAKWLSEPKKKEEPMNLMERTFGNAIEHASKHEKPPQPPKSFKASSET
ncbi:MAG: hypothetical protein CK425_01520 [Parachlamydia sp.]|jgi:hypothetical protein|nr:MAG: hypothetical protein CK425_01520 [Parachlamydia sp.]